MPDPIEKMPKAASRPQLQPPQVFDHSDLLKTPVQRAAYSDRTAWIMAAMSELAYFRFEGGQDFVALAQDLVSIKSADDIKGRLRRFLEEMDTDAEDGRSALASCLKAAGFDLVNVYNLADTQAFLAKRKAAAGSRGMRVLVFRGTEQKLADFRTDLDAALIRAPEANAEELIHKGFYESFASVRDLIYKDLKKDEQLPLYVTGHSLGGALAIVATRFIAKDSLGACYTFGGPRVGNLDMGFVFRTPIYRVVNSSDIVPRTPPAWLFTLVVTLLNWLHLPQSLINWLARFQGYVHFGDMRYLNHVEAGPDDSFVNLRLISNPSLPLRAGWVVSRWISTYGRAGIEDHSISLYRRKLRAYALHRN
ncbi:MAG: lipase family protein [Gammaproteobacteria bacterium]|nr:lipase family protein [Gammaproteobacteria bacterium]MDH3448541.1 lipase family protein [Gammaproteobacteria bacterium]